MNGSRLSFEDVNEKVRSDIEQYGWSVVASEMHGTLYMHTLGLQESFEHPELEVVGLPEELAETFLNELARWVKGGVKFEERETITELVENFEFVFVTNPFDPYGEPCTNGNLRLIWPDAQKRYPWDIDCEESCAAQTLLTEVPTSPHDLNSPDCLI